MKISEYIEKLQKRNISATKLTENKYFIDTKIIMQDGSALPVFLTSIAGELYFADYAGVLKDYNPSQEELAIIKKLAKKYGVTFEDYGFLLKVDGDIYDSFNDFVKVVVSALAICE